MHKFKYATKIDNVVFYSKAAIKGNGNQKFLAAIVAVSVVK
jgi:hypothetical protein